MLKRLLGGWLALALIAASSLAGADPAHYKIVTGPERGTYIQIGQDLSKWVAQPVGIDLESVASKGSAENVQRMRYEPNVKLALVQSDVYQAYLDMANAGNADAGTAIRPLRLIMPLYDEEINVVVRADSPLKTLADIKDKTISVGLVGSGSAQTATTLYRLMFGQPMPEQNIQHLSNEDALAALIVKKIDVAIFVVGQPANLFTQMNPELLQQLRPLRAEPAAPETQRASKVYFPTTLRASSYPTWLKDDVPALTVKAFLVTYDYGLRDTVGNLNRFADSLCANIDTLKTQGHPKWKQVKLELPTLVRGWKYYPPVEKHLRACLANKSAALSAAATTDGTPRPRASCSDQERLLLLCK